jgi:hypothetical protein
MILLEFINSLASAKHIEHPEDLIFLEGSAGASRMLDELATIPQNASAITIKYDGYPALIFGRNVDGQLVVADKHMFDKKDGSGRVTSVEAFKQYDVNRGANRGDLYRKLEIMWPGLEAEVGGKGYFWGDLLYTGTPELTQDHYVFKPNTVTYTVPAVSQLGQAIGQSLAGIAVHQYFPDFDAPPQAWNGQGLPETGQVLFIRPQPPVTPKLASPALLIKNAQKVIETRGAAADSVLSNAQIGPLLQRYINARVRGEMRGFLDWLAEKKPEMRDITDDRDGIQAALDIFQVLSAVKLDYVRQLDSQQLGIGATVNGQPGGEGYVYPTSERPIKLINRSGFSRANFAKNG